jgi:ppGpp synthetase/RelA/SpoT-type nucleotidyltranferase
MPRLTKRSQQFLDRYVKNLAELKSATELAEKVIRSVLGESRFDFYFITARTKQLDSLRRKLREHRYPLPDNQLTDSIGVRIITYYRNDVDRVVALLRSEFEVDESNSEDKRLSLGLRNFGYRSVHIIARLKPPRTKISEYRDLIGKWFEIQIRSILEHAWAEIEHEVVYKAGIKYPDETLRRFAAIAGTLEVLEGVFEELASERSRLIDSYRQAYQTTVQDDKQLDVARLLGFLEAVRPRGKSWRQAAASGQPFPARIETSCVSALKVAGLNSAAALRSLMITNRFRSAVKSFAAASGLEPAQISHLAVVTIAIAIREPELLKKDFSEISYDPAVERLLPRRLQNL